MAETRIPSPSFSGRDTFPTSSETVSSSLPEGTGILLCGHGSRDQQAVAEFADLAKLFRLRFPSLPVEYGYLEFARPILRTGLDALVQAGCRTIFAVPAMLFAAGHTKNDIPSVLNTYQAETPSVRISYGRALEITPQMLRAAADRITEALASSPKKIPLSETLLLVVGRGTSDPDANSAVAKLTRLLWEGMGFGWAETAYSGVTFPLVAPALAHAARLGYARIVVFPYFLFTGVLVERIYAAVDAATAQNPEIDMLKAGYLNTHPSVLDSFVARVNDIVTGTTAMNCQLCKYRAQILGFEADLGRPQRSHHHHVEGKEGHSHSHLHAHAHALPHAHSHPPYPHADHPLGPKSLQEVVRDAQDSS